MPGSHRFTLEWAGLPASQREASDRNMTVPEADPLQTAVQQIPIRAGCLLCWNSLLLHGNHPNQSERFRAVQYIRMLPVDGEHPYSPLAPDSAALYNKEFRPTELGARLFGFSPWSEAEAGGRGGGEAGDS